MSEDRSPQTESEPEIENEEGFFSLEAKAGLCLICILICGFSFMVWQQWKHQNSTVVADSGEPVKSENPSKEELADALVTKDSPPTQEEPSITLETADSDPFANIELPEIKTAQTKTTTERDRLEIADDPFTSIETQPPPEKANIPTLELPEEPSPGEANPFDPFGEKVAETEPEKPAEDTPSIQDSFDPFGPAEVKTPVATEDSTPTLDDPFAEPAPVKVAEQKPVELEKPSESNPFENVDPFGSVEIEKSNTEQPVTLESIPVEPKDDPFAEPAAEETPILTQESKDKPSSTPNSFQDPLPLLEPVPNATAETQKEPNPFGEFESVPAGAAQASSITDITPEKSAAATKGTLADLDAASRTASNLNSSQWDEDQFTQPATPTKSNNSFHLQPDGRYEVQQGDSYWSISRKAYGTPLYYRALAEVNLDVIPRPEALDSGKLIHIPTTQHLEQRYPHLVRVPSGNGNSSILKTSAEKGALSNDESGTPVYKVQKNDTLTGIAQKYLGRASRWIQIYELNRESLANPNKLKIGTTLKLPQDASRVKIVRE